MSDIQFKRGEFRLYRAITKVHIGSIEDDLHEGEVVEFDGTTMKRGPDVHQVSTLRSAIKIGWLVPDESEGGEYVALPAGVEIRPAESRGRERGPARTMGVVEDEERVVGTLNEVRGPKAPASHKATAAKEEIAHSGAIIVDDNLKPVRKQRVVTESGQEGKVIGRFKTSAKAAPIEMGSGDDLRAKAALLKDDGTGVQIDKARSGDTLDELLPNAASSGKPKGGIAGEGSDETADERAARLIQAKTASDARRAERMGAAQKSEDAVRGVEATVHSGNKPSIQMADKATVSNTNKGITGTEVTVSPGMTSVGGAEEGKVIGKISDLPKGAGPQAIPAQPRVPDAELSDEPDIVFESPEVAVQAADEVEDQDDDVVDDVPPEAIIQAKIEMIQQFVPGFEWDMSLQWRKRVKAALAYKGNMPTLNAILSIETEAVKKHVMMGLYG